jgi:hypothetical protein
MLYHYTSADGFKGIVESKTIFATDVRYLNDASELELAFDRLETILEELGNEVPAVVERALDEIRDPTLRAQFFFNTVSFSTERNSLSQWRAYCPVEGGYALGFDKDGLAELCHAQHISLKQCIYKRAAQGDRIRKFVRRLGRIAEAGGITDSSDLVQQALRFFDIAPLVKYPAFAEEQEWRIIAESHVDAHQYRSAKMLIPYVEIPLESDDVDFPLREVVIGPTAHATLAKRSAERFLAEHEVTAEVTLSDVPFRPLR